MKVGDDLPIALKYAVKALWKFFKQYAKNKVKDSDLFKNIIIIAAVLIVSVLILIFSLFGSLLCPILSCDDDTGKKEDVVTIGMLKDVSERMVQLRMSANSSVSSPGKNYGWFNIQADSKVDKTATENTGAEDSVKPIETNEEVEAQQASTTTVPTANPSQWIKGETAGLNQGFLNRLAAFGEAYGKPVPINSGFRTFEKQAYLYAGYKAGKPGFNKAAAPGASRHNYGYAADLSGWPQQLPSSALAPFGLYKAVEGENWHVEPVETKGLHAAQLTGLKIDGMGSSVTGAGAGMSGSAEQGDVSEAYVHLLALQQADDTEMVYYTKSDLDAEEKKKSNLGKTWTLAKAMKKLIKNHSYSDPDINKRANDDKWTNLQYMKLARWEIQKCFLIGDESKDGIFEKIFGGPKPCAQIKKLSGMEIVPEKLQGTISKTKKTDNGETIAFQKPEDILYSYGEISLYKKQKQFKPVMKEILEFLFEKYVAAQDLSSGGMTAPTFISPIANGTYTIETKYGEKLENGSLSKGIVMKTTASIPIWSPIGGKVVGTYKDESGGNTVVIQSPTYGFVEIKGLQEVLVIKDATVSQAILLGATFKDKPFEFRTCTKVSTNSPTPTCEDSSDPSTGNANISFSSGINQSESDKAAKAYPSQKSDALSGKIVTMPGYSNLSMLGTLSAEYESSGDPGVCEMDTAQGGLQCGTYQISVATGTMTDFMNYLKANYPQYYQVLGPVPKVIGSFKPAWRNLYNSDKQGFATAQHNFIGATHYTPVNEKIKKKYGFDANTRSRAVQEMIWSYAVQHRYNTVTAWGNAIGTGWTNMSDAEIVTKMYDYRLAHWPYTTRYKAEKAKALAMLGQ
ncbi:D-alanyl-D-alanine carboxypeptidase family protein [Priestia aryabhattai]|uniref:D-alanyl-D-alanine carboxypeptidase family protein n=1 Tax=Priestia aryabhattai TaxID=412384 RepID=A0AAX6NE07_PRIAR|nr:D-alanyl-D-alanine carboxypeptidase family protein [Priestia aryabhattai]MDU9693890.1 D-alanyl-D-alanine carboxypeptidase family protein [Priestia aryabhattai]